MLESLLEQLYRLMHMVVWVHTQQDQRWMLPIFVIVLVVTPAWLGWHLVRYVWSALAHWRRERARRLETGSADANKGFPSLERFVVRATVPFQARLVVLSLLTIPATYVLLLLPKHIINHALAEHGPGMDFLGIALDSEALLFALCASYLLFLTANSLIKYTANVVRGRVSERIVRRIRLAVIRRRRAERSPRGRATLAAVAIQECEPIGYFGGSLLVVPLIQGGTLLASVVFLFVQNVALAFAALMMLPLQIAVLPKLQRRINVKVRERVHATRGFNAALAHGIVDAADGRGDLSPTHHHVRQAEALEQVRLEITELKARFKTLYNYTSNLTPFFFFAIGGYLVLQQRLSLGALVAALAAYREIAPALRELFDFAQNWSDARARYVEVVATIQAPLEKRTDLVGRPLARLRLIETGSASQQAAAGDGR